MFEALAYLQTTPKAISGKKFYACPFLLFSITNILPVNKKINLYCIKNLLTLPTTYIINVIPKHRAGRKTSIIPRVEVNNCDIVRCTLAPSCTS